MRSRTTTRFARPCARPAITRSVQTDGGRRSSVANVHNSDHMGEEERQDLADVRQQASLELGHEIALNLIRYQSQKAAAGIEPIDKDPQAYIAYHGDDTDTDSEKRATKLAGMATGGRPTTGAGPTKTSSKDAAEG